VCGINTWVRDGAPLLRHIDSLVVPSEAVALWNLGVAGYVLKFDARIIYIDPYLRDPKDQNGHSLRLFPPPYGGADVYHADWVLCTHDHRDHLDPETIVPLAEVAPKTRFIVPAPLVGKCVNLGIHPRRIVGARTGETLDLSGWVVTPIPAAHVTFEFDEKGDHKQLGYVINTGALTLYHAGDTVDFPELPSLLRPHKIDIALLPINGNDRRRNERNIKGNLDFREAVDLAVDIGAKLVIPMHYDFTPTNNTNPAYFLDYLYHTYPFQAFRILALGECLIQDKQALRDHSAG
jgi:L-ascorbate 6-phosphate lactonase